jgi:hypothetical protein
MIGLFVMGTFCYGQSAEEPQTKSDYRTIAIGFDPLQLILGQLLLNGLVLSGNVEYAVTPNISLLIDLTYLIASGISGGQAGGGLRYYFIGKGLNGMWLGGYVDGIFVGSVTGFEAAILIGDKLVIGPVFIDPFVGLRIQSPQTSISSYFRWGVYIGIAL